MERPSRRQLEVIVFDKPAPAAAPPAPPLPQVTNLDRVRAEGLADRIQGLTAARTQLDHEFLTALADFDETRAWRWFDGITSTAHWLGWACSVAPGTAREHVRVARSLRRLPETNKLMAGGQLTYSKVRELSRLVPVGDPDPEPTATDALADDDDAAAEEPLPFDEERLCALALEMTASQLARTVRSYRQAAGSRIKAEAKRSLTLRSRDDGLTEIRVLLPTDDAALVQAALQTAQTAQSAQPSSSDDVPAGTPLPLVDALLDIARGYLATDARDPDDDHHLVTVLVDAETLTLHHDVPAGTPHSTDSLGSTCEIPSLGGVEPATAARFACDCDLIGAIRDSDGHILHLGRSRRTVSRAQRRALVARDRHCLFPGCTHTRWLKAHHIVHWAHGGPTDLPNLMLLCQRHHTAVHEGGVTITGHPDQWQFRHPDGTDLTAEPPVTDERLTRSLVKWAGEQATRPDHDRVFPPHAGQGYSVHECVAALFRIHGQAA